LAEGVDFSDFEVTSFEKPFEGGFYEEKD